MKIGTIKMLKMNTIKINLLASDIAYRIQQELYKGENNTIVLPLRKLDRESLLSRVWS